MHWKKIVVFILPLALSCKVPFNKKDIFEERASLPKDEAPHFKNSLEWWYFTGHLEDSVKQKTLGVEYVVFHFNPTRFKGGWMVNMAVSDPETKRFYYDHQLFPKKKDQFMELPLDFFWQKKTFTTAMRGEQGNYSIQSEFSSHPVSMKLNTTPGKGVVLHDGVGFENYGDIARAGYYSYPRLDASGSIQIESDTFNVSGNLWYDRQWNCSGVFDRKIAWDWFSIQFEETNSELMLYRLYSLVDSTVIYGGTYTNAEGESIFLENEQVNIEEVEYWKSEASKAIYPVAWKIEVPDLDLETDLKVLFPEQELNLDLVPMTKFFYWEGMCKAKGSIAGKAVHGNSYVEMANRFLVKEK